MALCETFKRRSLSTWNLLSKGRKINSQLLEETLTDVNLLEFKLKHPREVITKTFTKPKEGTTGADWEWWFTGSSGDWLGFRIQAKIIELQSSTYDHLHYKNPKSTFYQSDLLIQSALSNHPRLIPIYCLYSNWDGRKYRTSWPCNSFKQNVKNYGCSLISAFTVRLFRSKSKANDLQSLLPYMKPWHCLVCCQGYGEGDLPNRAWSYWNSQINSADRRLFRGGDVDLPEDALEGLSNFIGLYNEIRPIRNPPSYIIRMLEGQPIEPPDEGLRHITIFREIEQPEAR